MRYLAGAFITIFIFLIFFFSFFLFFIILGGGTSNELLSEKSFYRYFNLIVRNYDILTLSGIFTLCTIVYAKIERPQELN